MATTPINARYEPATTVVTADDAVAMANRPDAAAQFANAYGDTAVRKRLVGKIINGMRPGDRVVFPSEKDQSQKYYLVGRYTRRGGSGVYVVREDGLERTVESGTTAHPVFNASLSLRRILVREHKEDVTLLPFDLGDLSGWRVLADWFEEQGIDGFITEIRSAQSMTELYHTFKKLRLA